MPGHLARHMSAIHGTAPKRKAKANGRRRGRPGRPPGSSKKMSKHALGSMSLDQLTDLIERAREAARRQLKRLRSVFN